MKNMLKRSLYLAGIICLILPTMVQAEPQAQNTMGWKSLFNGKDLTGWKVPDSIYQAWTVKDGVIDCNPRQGLPGDQALWSEIELGDFQLSIEWRIKETRGLYPMPVILPDGTEKKDKDGNIIRILRPNADSGIYLRGSSKSQVNIWCWPVGSGEVYGYRTDPKMPPEVRAGVTPKVRADNPVGEWNHFLITMRGDRLTVELNGKTVINNAQLPGVPSKGPIALQLHGGYDPKTKTWNPASSLVQFRNIRYRELPPVPADNK